MSNFIISFFLAAGMATFVYTKLGNRIGYGNGGTVWKVVGVSFLATFLVLIILLSFVVHLN